jgi:hypothetical protein
VRSSRDSVCPWLVVRREPRQIDPRKYARNIAQFSYEINRRSLGACWYRRDLVRSSKARRFAIEGRGAALGDLPRVGLLTAA